MRRFFQASILCLMGLTFCLAVWAADSTSQIDVQLELRSIIDSIAKINGFKLLGLIAVIAQALVLAFKFLLERLSGIYRLLILNLLTLGIGIVLLRLQGMNWVETLLHSQTTAMAQVFFHQIIKQVLKKPRDDYAVLTKRISL